MPGAGLHSIRVTYWGVIGRPGDLLAIFKSRPGESFSDQRIAIDEQLGHTHWKWSQLTEAEFGTYQAFGIKEIKLS